MESKTANNSFLALFITVFVGLSSVNAQTTFDGLRAKFAEGQIFIAEFEHSYLDSYTQESTNTIGDIWINSVGYKLTSEQQTIVVDGELSQIYDANRNRVVISEYEAEDDDFAPSRMLSGIDDTYTATESDLENGNTLITLETTDDFATFLTVEIEVNDSIIPVKITAYDFADNIIITNFKNGSFQSEDESVFEFIFPEDAEIVDMRY